MSRDEALSKPVLIRGHVVATIAMPLLTAPERELGMPPHGLKLLYLAVDDGKASLQDETGHVIDVSVTWHGLPS